MNLLQWLLLLLLLLGTKDLVALPVRVGEDEVTEADLWGGVVLKAFAAAVEVEAKTTIKQIRRVTRLVLVFERSMRCLLGISIDL